jgi:hypothetical protein
VEFQRGIDGTGPFPSRPVGRLAEAHEHRLLRRSARLGAGTLACPRCDVPVALAAGPVSPAEPLGCPFCGHAAAVRDFLSLDAPARPARVEVRVVQPARRAVG